MALERHQASDVSDDRVRFLEAELRADLRPLRFVRPHRIRIDSEVNDGNSFRRYPILSNHHLFHGAAIDDKMISRRRITQPVREITPQGMKTVDVCHMHRSRQTRGEGPRRSIIVAVRVDDLNAALADDAPEKEDMLPQLALTGEVESPDGQVRLLALLIE